LFDLKERDDHFKDLVGIQDPNKFGADYVKCKSSDSRDIAYRLLINLSTGNQRNADIVLGCLSQLINNYQKINTNTSWKYSPSNDTRSIWGYAGIKNLGCICYMNAMLQQFFMTPAFRYGVLMAQDGKEANLQPKKDGKTLVDDNVVHQLQKMFGFLELTDRQDYNPHEFCFTFKDYDGNPVNVSEQQDTQEFLNRLFDKLEFGIKHTPFRYITESVYGGKMCNQMICNGCHNVTERYEAYYNLSLEVKNMKNVNESLEKMIQGETIDDYLCSNCKKKNSITKRACISELPNVMIIYLQRIIFDMDTLMNQKVNSRLEFPFELDFEPYTKEGLEWRERAKNKKKQASNKDGGQGSGSANKSAEDAKEDTEKEISMDKEDKEKGEENKYEEEPEDQNEEDLGPYKLKNKEYYSYRLVGTVCHLGTAEFGHYYSFINTNRRDPGKPDHNGKDRWLEFNDSTIRDFDLKNLEGECFGG